MRSILAETRCVRSFAKRRPDTLLIFMMLLFSLSLSHLALGQNFSISLEPLGATVFADTGGTFSYRVTVTNLESVPRSADVWGKVTFPNGTTRNGPGRTTQTFLGNQTLTWDRQEAIAPNMPVGYYTLRAYVGLYPSTIWAQTELQFQKQVLTGGVQQAWVARYNGPGNDLDWGRCIDVDRNCNAYVTGTSIGIGTNRDYATVKYNSSGIQQWVARYNGLGNYIDEPTCLAVDENGYVYVTGASHQGAGIYYYFVTIKYDSVGVRQWASSYNAQDEHGPTGLALDRAGNIYLTGVGNSHYITLKYNTAGVFQWVARYDGPGNWYDNATDMVLDENNNVYVTGYSYGVGTGDDYATVKYDSHGVQLWEARYHCGLTDRAFSIAVDASGNSYITGFSYNFTSSYDYATIKYNCDGVEQWVARYNGLANLSDLAYDVAVNEHGDVFVTGRSDGSETGSDIVTIKYDSAGVQQWAVYYIGPGNSSDEGSNLVLDNEGNIYVSGYSGFSSPNYDYDYTTIKYSDDGIEQWIARYNGTGSSWDEPYCLDVDNNRNVYVTGASIGSITNWDFATLKYTQPTVANWQQVEAVPFGAPLPEECRLLPPSPNPFNSSTAISYKLQASSQVELTVWDTGGRLVTTLVNGWRQAGRHEVTFDGAGLVSGVYFLRLESKEFKGVQKLVLIK